MSRSLTALRAAALSACAAFSLTSFAVNAAELGRLRQVSGLTPFTGCTADNVAGQIGTNYPDSEIEPWVAANPREPSELIFGWQQDRWSNGGSRGLVAGIRSERREGGEQRSGGAFRDVIPGPVTKCEGGTYTRASDPWVDFSRNGVAYYMHLVFQEDLPSGAFGPNAMLVTRSFDGGRSWGSPTALIADTDGQVLNDKNSLTADPRNAPLAYAVWDRLQDFTLPHKSGGETGGAAAGAGAAAHDGVPMARTRAKALKARAQKGAAPSAETAVQFKGPAYFTRTTDFGATWEPARIIFDPGNDAQTINNLVAVQPSGTVIDFFTHLLTDGTVRIDLVRSFDHGVTFGPPVTAAVIATDFGVVTPDAQTPVRDAAILFSVAVDRRSGALNLVWQDIRFHGINEVAFSRSTDGGLTWSAPVRINKTPANANPLRQQALIPTIAVGPRGVLVATYYDFRNDLSDGKESTDYFAVFCNSRKADCTQEANWGGEKRLTETSFDYLDAPVARGLFLGDYMGLKRAGDAVYPAFGMTTGKFHTAIFTRKIKFDD